MLCMKLLTAFGTRVRLCPSDAPRDPVLRTSTRNRVGRRETFENNPAMCDPRILLVFLSMYLQRQLAKDFSPGIVGGAPDIYRYHQVTLISGDRWQVMAKVQGSRMYQVNLFSAG